MKTSLYDLRNEAHLLFDPIWKTGQRSRGGAYMIIQDILKLPLHRAHIGLLTEQECLKLINHLETGRYWVGAGLRLPRDRKTIWQRPKGKKSIYENIEKIQKLTKGRVQQGSKKTKIFRKYRKGMEPNWAMIDALKS
jgi:hypothetical protein